MKPKLAITNNSVKSVFLYKIIAADLRFFCIPEALLPAEPAFLSCDANSNSNSDRAPPAALETA